MDTSKLHEEVAQRFMVPTLAILPSVSQNAPMASWSVSYDHLSEDEKARAQFMGVLHIWFCTCKWTAATLQSISRTSLKDSGEGKSSQRAELQAVYLVVQFSWIEK